MRTCILFCAGEFDRLIKAIGNEDYVIAADGGVLHTQKLNVRPNAVLGILILWVIYRKVPMCFLWRKMIQTPCWQSVRDWHWDIGLF